jgi:hypothetical protein
MAEILHHILILPVVAIPQLTLVNPVISGPSAAHHAGRFSRVGV